ncbi:LysR substrate-binding domain-containing protein [Achromobacter sp.]|jgi:DNA-binding transcriptional LysR family regulator|uniref:LysR family transcriptional regulator n=1 Tax=Achromobacter sp. TaxID=134375 RepID=UPI0028A9197F|nr:LysR substrate-binding domain-containing protein [Achromobacter sp.]
MYWQIEGISWAKRLKLRHLEIFLLLDHTGSITAAAQTLHLTQPAVSHWLADLEEVVGLKLFVRGRKLRLTPTGLIFRNYAMRTVGDVRRTDSEFKALKAGSSGRLSIGAIVSAAMLFLPRSIETFRQAHPGVQILVSEGPFDLLVEHLKRREVDLVLGPLDSRALATPFSTALLNRDSIVIVARAGHLIHQSKPAWTKIANYTWILPPHGTLTRATFEQSVLQKKLEPPMPAIETASLLTQQALLQESDHLGLLTRSMAEYYVSLGLVKIVPLALVSNAVPLGLLWDDAQIDQAARGFIELLKSPDTPA